MTGHEVTWIHPGRRTTNYFCSVCFKAVDGSTWSSTAPELHIRGPISLPAEAICVGCGKEAESDAPRFRDLTKLPGYQRGYEAGYGEAQKALPGSYLRILQQVLDRVLAGEPAAQVVADFPDEYGHTIEGLGKVERVLKAVEKWASRWVEGRELAVELMRRGTKPITLEEALFAAYQAFKEAKDA